MDLILSAERVSSLINWELLTLIVVLARWSKRYLLQCYPKVMFQHKVLVLSTIISFVYYYVGFIAGTLDNKSIIDLMITYFTATSFYELIFSPIERFLSKDKKSVKHVEELDE